MHNAHPDDFELHSGHAKFEDGTLNFLSLLALDEGLKLFFDQGPSLHRLVNLRVRILTSWVIEQLASMRWPSTDHPFVRIAGFPNSGLEQSRQHGGTLALVFYNEHGGKIPFDLIATESLKAKLGMRFIAHFPIAPRITYLHSSRSSDMVAFVTLSTDWLIRARKARLPEDPTAWSESTGSFRRKLNLGPLCRSTTMLCLQAMESCAL